MKDVQVHDDESDDCCWDHCTAAAAAAPAKDICIWLSAIILDAVAVGAAPNDKKVWGW